LPKLTDSDAALHALGAALRDVGAKFAVPSMLRLAPEVKEWFFGVLGQRYPQLLPLYQALYRRGSFPPAGWVKAVTERAARILESYGLSTHSYESSRSGGAQGESASVKPVEPCRAEGKPACVSSATPQIADGENPNPQSVQLVLPI
jgi:hypothetical protein